MGLWEMKFLQLLKVLGESLKFQQGKQRILWSPQSRLLSFLSFCTVKVIVLMLD